MRDKLTIKLPGSEKHTVDFAQWLNSLGHTATLNSPNGTYINNRWVVSDDWANEVMNDLWFDFESQKESHA